MLYRVSIKSLYNFENLLQRQMKRQIGGNYYERSRICLSFFLPRLTHLHMGTISCTKHIKTVLDFLHDLGRPCFPLSNTVSINFLRHAKIDELLLNVIAIVAFCYNIHQTLKNIILFCLCVCHF